MSRRSHTAVLLATVAMLQGCGGGGVDAESEARTVTEAAVRADAAFLGLSRLPDALMHIVEYRREYVAAIEVESSLAHGKTTAESMREVLRRNQAFIEAAIEGSRSLNGVLPESLELSEGDVRKNMHLSQPRVVLLNNARVLRADAVRCWGDQALEKCAERFSAALDIAAYLLSHEDRQSRFRGGQAFIPTLFDLNAVCEAGFATLAPASSRSALGARIRSIDPERRLYWDETSDAARVRRSLIETLSE